MARCTICEKRTHLAAAHRQSCFICDGDALMKGSPEEVNPRYRCNNEPRHEQIRAGFGDPLLVAQTKAARAKVKIPKGQLRLVE